MGEEGDADAALDHALGGFDRLHLERHVGDEAGAPEEPVAERPIARAAVEEDQRSIGDDLELPIAIPRWLSDLLPMPALRAMSRCSVSAMT